MPRVPKPFITPRRNDAKTYQISLNPSSGLPEKICQEWKRRSFQDFPPELAQYRYPKTKPAAEAGVFALIEFLKKEPSRLPTDRIEVGAWLKKFTMIEGNPRSARVIAKNRPYSVNTINRYEGLFRVYIDGDPFTRLLMQETEEADALECISRLARRDMTRKDLKGKYKLVGTGTFEKIIKFIRMALSREMGPTKGKKERLAPFDSVLQEAIKKLWEENGEHEYVFSFANGKTPGPSWIKGRFKKWIARAGIELNGRKIVPHSSRHSLASLLEARGVSLRYIQELLGHSDLKTTKTYLHSTDATIRDVGKKIETALNEQPKTPENVSRFEKTG